MPRYKIVEIPTYLSGTLRHPGDVVEFDGWPGSTLEPVEDDPVAVRVKAHYSDARSRGKKLPLTPDFAQFADPPEAPAKPAAKAKPGKDD